MSTVLHGARLSEKTRRDVVDYISSREDDRRIARSIILVNEAHVVALTKAKVLTRKEAAQILRELRKLENRFPQHDVEEDYHLYVEQKLTKKLGESLGGKIHAGKSRNDQVATAIRLTLRDSLLSLSRTLLLFADKMMSQASKYANVLFVGYTHLQPAQPITYGHYLVAIADSFLRDTDRILSAYPRVNVSPMGSAAIAGSSFNLDRRLVASLLGFDGLIENSLDAVGSRDFLLESLAVCSIIASDLSRAAQDWIFYSSADVGLLEIQDEYTSTSSIMPQKKNPDPLEVVRARSALIVGNYSSATTMMHSITSGYNLDFQEITPLMWKSVDMLTSSLSIMTGIISSARPAPRITDKYQAKFTVATEIANTLVRETGVPFRQAYRWVGQAVRIALLDHRTLKDLTVHEWINITGKALGEKAYKRLQDTADPANHSRIYRTEGSPNLGEVKRMISSRKYKIREYSRTVSTLTAQSINASRGISRFM